MDNPTTIREAVAAAISRRPKLRRNHGALLRLINEDKVVVREDDTVVARNQDTVDKEVDMRERAIDQVVIMGSAMTRAQIWPLLQSLPDKDVNALARNLIKKPTLAGPQVTRHIAWTEILNIRDEARLFEAKGGLPFNDPSFSRATMPIKIPVRATVKALVNSGAEITLSQVREALG